VPASTCSSTRSRPGSWRIRGSGDGRATRRSGDVGARPQSPPSRAGRSSSWDTWRTPCSASTPCAPGVLLRAGGLSEVLGVREVGRG
jgi:hypothetical protein